jgi:hypothetical protein
VSFTSTYTYHLQGKISKCSGVYRYSTEEFIEKAKKYTRINTIVKFKYINYLTRNNYICKIHGSFTKPTGHFSGCGLLNAIITTKKNLSFSIEEFIENQRKHGDKYDSRFEYINYL